MKVVSQPVFSEFRKRCFMRQSSKKALLGILLKFQGSLFGQGGKFSTSETIFFKGTNFNHFHGHFKGHLWPLQPSRGLRRPWHFQVETAILVFGKRPRHNFEEEKSFLFFLNMEAIVKSLSPAQCPFSNHRARVPHFPSGPIGGGCVAVTPGCFTRWEGTGSPRPLLLLLLLLWLEPSKKKVKKRRTRKGKQEAELAFQGLRSARGKR